MIGNVFNPLIRSPISSEMSSKISLVNDPIKITFVAIINNLKLGSDRGYEEDTKPLNKIDDAINAAHAAFFRTTARLKTGLYKTANRLDNRDIFLRLRGMNRLFKSSTNSSSPKARRFAAGTDTSPVTRGLAGLLIRSTGKSWISLRTMLDAMTDWVIKTLVKKAGFFTRPGKDGFII